MAEIQTLVSGFDETAPLGVRWRTLAGQKLAELEVMITRAQCLNLDECLPLVSASCL
jgi:hypothetical protein